ncbi:MAG: hypothetical protein ACRDFB_10735, partial [Rhabdochlamydiaceae bacterium]
MKLFFDFERGPRLIQNYQTSLEWWIPEVPNDAVWGCVKSTTISFLITLFFTEGNVLIASK